MRIRLAVAVLLLPVWARAQQGMSREISFPSVGTKVPGTLTLPGSPRPDAGWPIVVLVQGSGPNDRDETIGPNKIFKDIAEGLAGRGIATIRYDKRTYRMRTGEIKLGPGDLAKITLSNEVVDDAVAALTYAATLPEVDHKKVFLLGHSLGGTLAPRIAAERLKAAAGSVHGIVELAAGAMPITVLLPLQSVFQGLLRGGDVTAVQGSGAQMQTMLAEALNPATAADKIVMGVPASYWREWANTDAAAGLKAVALPALVLHGTKDVQILYLDYVLMSNAAVAPGSRSIEFVGLNHLFEPVIGEGSGDEYKTPSHVAAQVIDAIATWVSK